MLKYSYTNVQSVYVNMTKVILYGNIRMSFNILFLQLNFKYMKYFTKLFSLFKFNYDIISIKMIKNLKIYE